jgi:hypothetical protein
MPDMMLQSEFWSSFLSNLMATLLGVALGIPSGLYLNRRAEQQRMAAERREQDARLMSLVRIVTKDIENIAQDLVEAETDVRKGGIKLARIETQTWAAVSRDFLVDLTDFGDLGVETAEDLAVFHLNNTGIQFAFDLAVNMYFQSASYPAVPPGLVLVMQSIERRCATNIGLSKKLLQSLKEIERLIPERTTLPQTRT